MPTHYEVLGVDPSSEAEVIEAAYRALMRKYHPDRAGDNDRVRKITAAYEVLKSPVKRRAYDATLKLFPSREIVKSNSRPTGEQQSARPRFQQPRNNETSPRKRCLECGEVVPGMARQCRYCGHRFHDAGWLTDSGRRAGCIILFLLAIIFLVLIADTSDDSLISDSNLTEAVEPAEPATIPITFQGRWATTTQDCEAGRKLLIVDSDGYEDESTGELVSLTSNDDASITPTFRSHDGNEFSETWTTADGGQSFFVSVPDGDGASYVRCPNPAIAKLKSKSAPQRLPELEWSEVGTGGGYRIWVNPGSLIIKQPLATIWVKAMELGGNEAPFFMFRLEFNCAEATYKLIEALSYDADGALIDSLPPDTDGSSESVAPTTTFDAVSDKICARSAR